LECVAAGGPLDTVTSGLECRWQGGPAGLLESAEDLVDPDRFHVNGVRLIVPVLAEQRNCVFSRFCRADGATSPRCEQPAITASFPPSW